MMPLVKPCLFFSLLALLLAGCSSALSCQTPGEVPYIEKAGASSTFRITAARVFAAENEVTEWNGDPLEPGGWHFQGQGSSAIQFTRSSKANSLFGKHRQAISIPYAQQCCAAPGLTPSACTGFQGYLYQAQ